MDLENGAAPLTSAADRLLGVIKRRGPQRAADLAAALGITAEAVRQQLLHLEQAGLIRSEAVQGNVGRPSRLWHLTSDGHARFPDTHAELTVQLIDAMRAELGSAAVERVIDARQAETQRSYQAALDGTRSLAARVARLAEIRAREGYMAQWRRNGKDFILLENHCPICAAARACQGFCRSELDLFRAVLGPDVAVERTEHLLQGARRCAYRIAPAATKAGTRPRR
jgi:predicted ArsR family transcriptional regulator